MKIRLKNKPVYPIAGIFLLVMLSASSIFFYYKYQKAQKTLNDPNALRDLQVKELINRLNQFIELPKNEEPTVATVSNKDQLKSQSFFKNAENGDKILIYTDAKKAILYRPSSEKIIEIAPINLGSPSGSM